MRELSCAELIELCPEVALGVADAQDRASVLAHVERCRACRDELGTLSDASDLLCAAVPPVEPPSDLAPRVVKAISRSSRDRSRPPSSRRSAVRPLSVAAAVVLATALGVGGWLATGNSTSPPSSVAMAPFFSAHRTVGQVVTVPGEEPWISVAVHLRTAVPKVRCEVESAGGRWQTVGSFDVYHGWGYWAAPLRHGTVLRRAELLTPAGKVIATASFARA